jgi:hypothetical protein
MPFAALIPLLTTVVPLLVGHADEKHPGDAPGSVKRQWVHDSVREILELVLPAAARPAEEAITLAIDVVIELELDRLEAKPASSPAAVQGVIPAPNV